MSVYKNKLDGPFKELMYPDFKISQKRFYQINNQTILYII